VRQVSRIPGIEEVSLTTNGIALARYAHKLAKAGLRRVNISLDTLRPDRFHAITRLGRYEHVREGIAAARAAGLSPLKLNVVVMQSVNDDEMLDFARSTLDEDWEVRFIELMPFMEEQETCIKDTSLVPGFVPTELIKGQIEAEFGPLEPAQTEAGNGPARYYRIPGARGKIGFISPMTEQRFCELCNRMRLTADGKLRPCLLTDHEVDLKAIIRSGGGDESIRQGILQALRTKPDAHHLWDGNRPRWRRMIQIGG
jgi:cyclic pyranopterin phosphate synthase